MLSCARFTSSHEAEKHLSIDVERAFEGFIVRSGTPTGTAEFYGWLENPTHIAKTCIYVIQSVVGDGFMVCFYESPAYSIVSNRVVILVDLPCLRCMGQNASYPCNPYAPISRYTE